MSSGHVARKVRSGKPRYYVVIESDPDSEGRRVRKSHGGFDRLKDAKARLASVLEAQASGNYIEPSKLTVGQYLRDEWLPGIKSTIRASTFHSYERNIELHVIPTLGNVPLQKLTPSQLNALYAALAEGERPLSPKTIRYLHTIVHRAMRDATKWGRLSRNPAAAADPPRQVKSEMRAWDGQSMRRFLAGVTDDRLYPLYLLAATTGMRRGELLGLRWVDLEDGRLSVRQTLISVAYKAQFSEPKTNRSRRTIALDPATLAALRAHRASQSTERLAWGPAWVDTELVFTRENGELIHPQALSDAFEAHVKRLELPKLSFHGLRHTYATQALASGMKPWDLSDRLGHASVAFTLSSYRHAIQSTQDSAAESAAAFILGG